MGLKPSYRTHPGPLFSEGSRLLWCAAAKEPGGREGLTRRLDLARGELSPWLYGDKQPGRKKALLLLRELKIAIGAWDAPPTEKFVLPANAPPPAQSSARPVAKTRVARRRHTGTGGV